MPAGIQRNAIPKRLENELGVMGGELSGFFGGGGGSRTHDGADISPSTWTKSIDISIG